MAAVVEEEDEVFFALAWADGDAKSADPVLLGVEIMGTRKTTVREARAMIEAEVLPEIGVLACGFCLRTKTGGRVLKSQEGSRVLSRHCVRDVGETPNVIILCPCVSAAAAAAAPAAAAAAALSSRSISRSASFRDIPRDATLYQTITDAETAETLCGIFQNAFDIYSAGKAGSLALEKDRLLAVCQAKRGTGTEAWSRDVAALFGKLLRAIDAAGKSAGVEEVKQTDKPRASTKVPCMITFPQDHKYTSTCNSGVFFSIASRGATAHVREFDLCISAIQVDQLSLYKSPGNPEDFDGVEYRFGDEALWEPVGVEVAASASGSKCGALLRLVEECTVQDGGA